MAKSLKEIFGLREMAMNVPDKDVPALRKHIDMGIKQGLLPQDASAWLPSDRAAKGTPAPGVKAGAAQAAKPSAPPPTAKADIGKSLGGWAAHKAKSQDYVNPAKSSTPELDDPWFADDEPAPAKPAPKKAAATPPPIPKAALKKAKQPLAPHLPAPKSANVKMGKGSADFKPQTDWSKDVAFQGEFPDMPAPQSANQDIDNTDDYKSPFAGLGLGTGGSSWDDIPAYLRDPEQMPRAGGGSQRVPRSPEMGADDDIGAPGKPPKKNKGPSPVGAPWSAKDAGEKKPGMLSRLFGKKGSK